MKKEANILKIQKGTLVVLNYVNVRNEIAEISNLETTYTEHIDYVGEGKLLSPDIYDGFGVSAKNQLPNFKQDDWINIPSDGYNSRFTLEPDLLALVYDMVAFTGTDDRRPIMKGICFNKDGVCVTDAHKLKYSFDSVIDSEVVICTDVFRLLKLKKVKRCIIQVSKDYIKIEMDSFKIESRIIDGRYPNFRAVIPDTHNLNAFEINKRELLSALSYIKPAVNKSTNRIKFKLSDVLNISAEDIDKNTSADMDIKMGFNTGCDLEIGFNIRFIELILKSLNADVIKFQYSKPNRAVLIGSSCLLMPVAL